MLRAPRKNARAQNIGAKWLRNNSEFGSAENPTGSKQKNLTTVHGEDRAEARFKKISGRVCVISGENKGICLTQRNYGDRDRPAVSQDNDMESGKTFETDTLVINTKRKRIDTDNILDYGELIISRCGSTNGTKNVQEAGHVLEPAYKNESYSLKLWWAG